MEVIDAVLEVFEPHTVGVKLSPVGNYNDMTDSDPIALFSYVLEALSSRKIGFVEVTEYFSFDASNDEMKEKFFHSLEKKTLRANLRSKFNGFFMTNH